MRLIILEERREKGGLTKMYKLMNHMEKVDRQVLEIHMSEGARSFIYCSIELWNSLSEELVTAVSVSNFIVKLDNYGYGERIN